VEKDIPLTERNVARRGLLAGLASLGALAALKLGGAEKAAAANGEQLIIGNTNFPAGSGTPQTATNLTELRVDNAESKPALVVQKNLALNFGSPHAIVGANSSATFPAIRAFNNSSGPAIEGIVISSPTTSAGVIGISGADGVRGISKLNGTGVLGVSNNGSGGSTTDVTGSGSGIGVHGKSTGGPGLKGESTTAPGVDGVSVGSLGVRGTSTNFVGVVGISTNSHGLYGFSTSANGVGLVGDNQGGGLAGLFQGSVVITGGLQVGGAKNAVIKMQDGSNAVVYCQESPEPYFEDFGRTQLVGGVANVTLEREFAQLVAAGDYMVTLTPEGPSWLYVSRRSPSGFEVREGNNGTSNVSFTYRIVTKRKDVEGKRFARVSMQPAQNLAAARASLGLPGVSAPPVVVTSPPGNMPPFSPPAQDGGGGGPTSASSNQH
jgi:hypothetical protein